MISPTVSATLRDGSTKLAVRSRSRLRPGEPGEIRELLVIVGTKV